jgi:uncharacterized protein DUF7003
MVVSVFTGDDVLGQLDQAARDHRFPAFDHADTPLVDARLHGFRDRWRWAVIVETVVYDRRLGNLVDVLHAFGSGLTDRPGATDHEAFLRVDDIEAVVDDEGRLADGVTAVTVDGALVPVTGLAGSDMVDVFRSLVPIHRGLLLADEKELRTGVLFDLFEVLRLDEWHHPDLSAGELPSDSETFRLLADLLVTGDLSRWQPTEHPNTHWKNWSEAGAR